MRNTLFYMFLTTQNALFYIFQKIRTPYFTSLGVFRTPYFTSLWYSERLILQVCGIQNALFYIFQYRLVAASQSGHKKWHIVLESG